MIKSISKLIILFIVSLSLTNCSDGNSDSGENGGADEWSLKTTIGNIKEISFIVKGNFKNRKRDAFTEQGFCWSTDPMPIKADNSKSQTFKDGDWTLEIKDGIRSNTKYYIRTYAENKNGIVYGNTDSCTTLPVTKVNVSACEISNLESYSVTVTASIDSISLHTITEQGFCWDMYPSPTVAKSKMEYDKHERTFTCKVEPLKRGTKYYVRAYAVNEDGTHYGKDITFTTKNDVDWEIKTLEVTEVTSNSFKIHGSFKNSQQEPFTSRGFCWGLYPDPTKTSTSSWNSQNFEEGTWSTTINNNIKANTKYYIRAYSANATDIVYGNTLSFTTTAASDIDITTNEVVDIKMTSATAKVTIGSTSGHTVKEKGICWSMYPSATIANSKITYSGTGSTFSSSMSSLAKGTKYYVRGYVITDQGTYYGNELTFTTSSFAVGVSYGGGLIAYIDATGEHGIIVSPSDQGTFVWSPSNIQTNATATGIGTGKANTDRIYSVLGAGNYAAEVCYNLQLNGYSDWVLPSFDEIKAIKDYLKTSSNLSYTYYWSSSEQGTDGATACYVEISYGTIRWYGKYFNKTNNCRVRAIRYF